MSRRLRTTLAGIVLAASLTPATLVAAAPTAIAATTPLVAVANVNLRTGPGTGYSVITLVPAGASLTATGPDSGNWTPVTYAGNTGWVYNTYVEATGSTSSAATAVTTDDLNVRTGPGTSYSVVDVAWTGTTVTLTGNTSGSWSEIDWEGSRRWVSSYYLSDSAPVYNAPAVSSAGQKVADYALARLGAPYSLGSKGPVYYDCSGLVTAAHEAAGVYVPYSMTKQATTGEYVSRSNLQPGDVVVWKYNTGGVRAVSIYVGNDTIVIADGYTYGTRTDTITNRSSWSVFGGGRRHV